MIWARYFICFLFRKVRQWLDKVFDQDEVPDYEIHSQTVDYLFQLAQRSESKEKALTCMLEDFQQKTTEYQAESKTQAHKHH